MMSLPCLRSRLRRSAFCSLAVLAFSASPLLYGQSVTYTGSTPALDFGSVNVCPSGATSPAPCSKTLTLTYKVIAGGTLGTPKVVTAGAPNLDYTLAAGGTCTGLVTGGATCGVNVTLAPLYAGERKGAVEIVDGSGNVLTTTLIHGIGVGPQIAFDPAAQTTLGVAPFGANDASLAIDGLGYLYVQDYADGTIMKFPAGGGAPTAGPNVGIAPAIALDGADDIFLINNGAYVIELPVGGGGPITRYYGLPQDIAVDGSGNLFVLYSYYASPQDDQAYTVAELPAGGGATVTLPFTGLGSNHDYALTLAVDERGDVFVSDILSSGSGPTHIFELPAAGGGQVMLPFTFSAEGQMVGDAAGDLFVGNSTQIEQVPAGANEPIVIGSFANPKTNSYTYQNLAVSSAGDVFGVLPNSNLVAIRRSQPPPLSFPETKLGSTSIPLSVQVQNIGNAALSLGGLSTSGPFALVSGPGTPADCTAGTSLAPGGRCNLSVTFTPESESVVTGTVTLSDNALNAHATQVIPLSGPVGDAPQAKLSSTTVQFGNIPYPTGSTLPLTITNIGGGTLTIAPSINGPSYTIASSTCAAGVASGDTCVLQVRFAPVAVGVHDDILTLVTNGSLNNGPTTLAVPLKALATGVGALETEATLQFGSVDIFNDDEPVVLPLTIYNYGIPGMVTVGVAINGPSYTIVGSTCTGGVAAGGNCTLQVQYLPVSPGTHDDVLTLTPSGGAASSTVKLKGTTPSDGG